MEITEKQFEKIKDSLPIQRGNVKLQNLTVVNAILFVAEHGCKWRGFRPVWQLAQHLYAYESLAKKGVLDRVFREVTDEQIVRIKIEPSRSTRPRSRSIQTHGRVKKNGPSYRQSRGGWNTRFIWLPQMLERQ